MPFCNGSAGRGAIETRRPIAELIRERSRVGRDGVGWLGAAPERCGGAGKFKVFSRHVPFVFTRPARAALGRLPLFSHRLAPRGGIERGPVGGLVGKALGPLGNLLLRDAGGGFGVICWKLSRTCDSFFSRPPIGPNILPPADRRFRGEARTGGDGCRVFSEAQPRARLSDRGEAQTDQTRDHSTAKGKARNAVPCRRSIHSSRCVAGAATRSERSELGRFLHGLGGLRSPCRRGHGEAGSPRSRSCIGISPAGFHLLARNHSKPAGQSKRTTTMTAAFSMTKRKRDIAVIRPAATSTRAARAPAGPPPPGHGSGAAGPPRPAVASRPGRRADPPPGFRGT